MKLLTKTSLLYLLTTVVVFLAGAVIFYYNLHNIIDEETDEQLYSEKVRLQDFVKKNDTLPANSITSYDFFTVTPSVPVKESVKDTFIYSNEEEELLPYRQLSFPVQMKGQSYKVAVSKSLFESDDLMETIFYSLGIIVVILLAVTLTVNRFIVGKLWRPFFGTVKKLHDYRVDQQTALHFEKVGTTEFRELNEALEKMTEKIAADYQNLKSFTENASHELQTPLSVIMNSTELLLQQENSDEKQVEMIQRVHEAAGKLSKLNKALLLLAKIENRQFAEKESIDVTALLGSKLEFYSELIAHKEIRVEKLLSEKTIVDMHPALADVLVSNLLVNAIRHTEKGGTIGVQSLHDSFSIANSGQPLRTPEKMFQRFYKENPSSESTGLGLALVKEIAETNGLQIGYSFAGGMHHFTVRK